MALMIDDMIGLEKQRRLSCVPKDCSGHAIVGLSGAYRVASYFVPKSYPLTCLKMLQNRNQSTYIPRIMLTSVVNQVRMQYLSALSTVCFSSQGHSPDIASGQNRCYTVDSAHGPMVVIYSPYRKKYYWYLRCY
jgi:hypothetical protein